MTIAAVLTVAALAWPATAHAACEFVIKARNTHPDRSVYLQLYESTVWRSVLTGGWVKLKSRTFVSGQATYWSCIDTEHAVKVGSRRDEGSATAGGSLGISLAETRGAVGPDRGGLATAFKLVIRDGVIVAYGKSRENADERRVCAGRCRTLLSDRGQQRLTVLHAEPPSRSA